MQLVVGEERAVADSELPVEGSVEVAVPIRRLWEIFCDVADWPSWNGSFWAARVGEGHLSNEARLVWAFNPIRPWYLYKLPAVAQIVEFDPERRVTWEVTTLPGFHARHSYVFEDLGNGRSTFGSWEVAEGLVYRWIRPFWLAHFRYVCRESLRGAATLAGRRVKLLEFRWSGTKDAPPLVVIPGIDGSAASVEPIVRRLAGGRRVFIADYRAEANPSLERLTDEVEHLVHAEVGDSPVDVLGQSIGTVVAAQLASRRRAPVRFRRALHSPRRPAPAAFQSDDAPRAPVAVPGVRTAAHGLRVRAGRGRLAPSVLRRVVPKRSAGRDEADALGDRP